MTILELEVDLKNRKTEFNNIPLMSITETEFNEPDRRPEPYQLESIAPYWKVFLRAKTGENMTARIVKRDGAKFLGITEHAENPEHADRMTSFRTSNILKVLPAPGARRDDLKIGYEALTPTERIERLMGPIDRAYRAEQALTPGASVEILTRDGETLEIEITETDGDEITGTVIRSESGDFEGEELAFRRGNVVRIVSGPRGEP